MSKLSYLVLPQSPPLSNEYDSLTSQGLLGVNAHLTHSKGSNNYGHSTVMKKMSSHDMAAMLTGPVALSCG